MKIALLSCGRSDFSIYLPLIKKLKQENIVKAKEMADLKVRLEKIEKILNSKQ